MSLKILQVLSDNQCLVNTEGQFKVVNYTTINGRKFIVKGASKSLVGTTYRLTLQNERQLNAEESAQLLESGTLKKQVSNGLSLTREDIATLEKLDNATIEKLGFIGKNLSLKALQQKINSSEKLPVMPNAYARYINKARYVTITLSRDGGVGVVSADSGVMDNLEPLEE